MGKWLADNDIKIIRISYHVVIKSETNLFQEASMKHIRFGRCILHGLTMSAGRRRRMSKCNDESFGGERSMHDDDFPLKYHARCWGVRRESMSTGFLHSVNVSAKTYP